MNFGKLFEMQRGLDEYIEGEHGLKGENLFERKVLALLVEIGELANETRCFKFWSLKKSSPQNVVLEEFVDGIHFILSLGIECGFTQLDVVKVDDGEDSMTEKFLQIYREIDEFRLKRSFESYLKLFTSFLSLAKLLGFSEGDIEIAYIEKNEVNYQRQKQGY